MWQCRFAVQSGITGCRLQSVVVDEGANVTLSCTDAPPDQTIKWSKTPGSIRDKATKQHDGRVLVIKDAKAEDAGQYTCTAGSYVRNTTLRVTLAVAVDFSLRILNWNYTEAYSNKSSKEYINFQKNFTSEMDKVFRIISGYVGTEILNVSDGSLRVSFRVKIRYTVNSSDESTTNVKVTLTNKIIIRAKTGWLESLQVDKSPKEFKISSPPPAPRGAKASSVTPDGAILEWLPPIDHEYYHILGYRIKYWEHATTDKVVTSPDIKVNKYKLTGLDSEKHFNAHVFAVNDNGNGVESKNMAFKTAKGPMAPWLIAIIVVIIIIIIGITLIAAVIYRKRYQRGMELRATDGNANIAMKDIMKRKDVEDPEFLSYRNLMMEDQVHCEVFPKSDLRLLDELGSGQFGVVTKGELTRKDGDVEECAVKCLKGFAGEEEMRALYQELDIMWNVGYHPNLINLIGACCEKGQLLVVVEFANNGCLLDLLRSQRGDSSDDPIYQNMPRGASRQFEIDHRTKIGIAMDVTQGMEYLASKMCVHRDLAARNVLIADGVAKVADFGLSRDIYETGEYEKTTAGGKLPVKWMAIESLETMKYTVESDVWSFGVLLWEIETKGLLPHAGMDYKVLITKLKEGYRLDKPPGCSDTMYLIMRHCWLGNPKDRPTFSQLRENLALLQANK